jgi:hypothetical protein
MSSGAENRPTLSNSTSAAALSPHDRVVSRGRLITGRVLSTLATLFLLFDAFGKLAKPASVVEASARIGFPLHLLVPIGVILLICTILYAIPRTAVFGAVLLTGYLGGAVEAVLSTSSPVFEVAFPVIFGVILWAGIFLREPRLLQLFPLRRTSR